MDDLSFLQGISFVDSFFPSGGYAHSFGIETAVHQGVIKNGKDLENYLVHWLREGVLRSDGIAVSIANQSIGLQDFDAIVEADQQLQAMKTAQEVREASRQMGRQVIEIIEPLNGYASSCGFRVAPSTRSYLQGPTLQPQKLP